MKTLVNKDNPAIRITAPEITIEEIEAQDGKIDRYYKVLLEYKYINLLEDNWTLVEEEPVKLTSKYLKESEADKQVVEKMSKELAKIITDQIAEPVDLEKLIEKAQRVLYSSNPDDYIKLVKELAELGKKGGK